MVRKHGLSQGRINYAKDHAKRLVDDVAKIEMLFHLSNDGHIDKEKAENGIHYLTKEIEDCTRYLLEYIRPRKDMK